MSLALTGLAAALWVIQTRYSTAQVWCYMLTYGPQVLALAPPIAVGLLCLMVRQRGWFWYNVALTLLVAHVFLRPAWPHRPARYGAVDRIRVVTWNVHNAHPKIPRMAAVLAELDPDIVCLQETWRDDFRHVLPGAQFARTHEVTVLTRGRIVGRRVLKLGDSPNFRHGLETEIELPQGRVKVLNVHWMAVQLPHPVRGGGWRPADRHEETILAREKELAVTLDWIRKARGPALAVGDFNTPPNAPEYRALERVARNAFLAGRGLGFTFHRRLPLIRIDHVWCVGDLRPVKCWTMDSMVSDHRPVVADIVLGRSRATASQ